MKKAIKYLSLGLGLFLFASLFAYSVFQWMRVDRIEIEIEKNFASDQSVEDLHSRLQKKFQPFVGERIKDIVLKNMVDIAKSEPQVADAGVLRLLPHHLLVQVHIRKPLLVYLDKKGYMHPLSIDGTLLPPLKPWLAPDLPIVRGNLFLKKIQLRRLAIAFTQKLPKGGKLRKSISEIHYSPKEASLVFILEKGRRIRLGKNPKPIQMPRIESVLQYLEQQNIKWRVIDARFSQKIVVSTK